HSGRFIRLVRRRVSSADRLLAAATLYRVWQGTDTGFDIGWQFLPNPQETDPVKYDAEAGDLIGALWAAYDDPRAVLTNTRAPDLDYYNSLPERFTVYRGGYGLPAEQLARGVCWTTRRPIAEWFAIRFRPKHQEPVLVSARIDKREVALAFSSEYEIACRPY